MTSRLSYLHFMTPSMLTPKLEVPSIADINPESLVQRGIKGLILDADNTIRHYHGAAVDERVLDACYRLTTRIKSCVLSNSTPEGRAQLRSFLGLHLHVVETDVRKPFPEAFNKAMDYLGTTPVSTAMIGDRLLTDIAGANNLGIYRIKVRPLRRMPFVAEPFPHSLARWFETLLLRTYQE